MRRDWELEPLAPVMGGGRWRRPRHDIVDLCRRYGGVVLNPPSRSSRTAHSEPGEVLDPLFVSTPPSEARVGGAYVYRARAHAAGIDGFTWYFEKRPPGMVVDRHTGAVVWTPAEGGYFEVVLCAASLYGAASRQSWTICVRKAVAVRRVAPNPRFAAASLRKRRGLRGAGLFRIFWGAEGRRVDPQCRPAAPPGGRPAAAFSLRL